MADSFITLQCFCKYSICSNFSFFLNFLWKEPCDLQILRPRVRYANLVFNFDQTSHHALVLSFSFTFCTFANYLVDSRVWEKLNWIFRKNTEKYRVMMPVYEWLSHGNWAKKAFLWIIISRLQVNVSEWMDDTESLISGVMTVWIHALGQKGRLPKQRLSSYFWDKMHHFACFSFVRHASFSLHPTSGALTTSVQYDSRHLLLSKPLLSQTMWRSSFTFSEETV